MLGQENEQNEADSPSHEGAQDPHAMPDADVELDGADDNGGTAVGGAPPLVIVSIQTSDCGACFELLVTGAGGLPPYLFQWDDGSVGDRKQVCIHDGSTRVLSVVAVDASAVRSVPQPIELKGGADTGCPPPPPTPLACLGNLSFEGMPAANVGTEEMFDGAPWTTCTNPAAINTPNILNSTITDPLNESVDGGVVEVPAPTEGDTFLVLGEAQQVSQPFCQSIPDGATLSVEFDLARLNAGAGVVPETEQVFLEVWGGLAVDCSQRELLWASPALKAGWQRYCVKLRPDSFMDQLTLRANADGSQAATAYMLVDNMRPVEHCP